MLEKGNYKKNLTETSLKHQTPALRKLTVNLFMKPRKETVLKSTHVIQDVKIIHTKIDTINMCQHSQCQKLGKYSHVWRVSYFWSLQVLSDVYRSCIPTCMYQVLPHNFSRDWVYFHRSRARQIDLNLNTMQQRKLFSTISNLQTSCHLLE